MNQIGVSPDLLDASLAEFDTNSVQRESFSIQFGPLLEVISRFWLIDL